jgi:hypothetical protein
MGDLLDTLTGGPARRSQQQNATQLQSQQYSSLASLAARQAEVDQAGASSSGGTRRQRGRGLLTFVRGSLGGSGQAKLG